MASQYYKKFKNWQQNSHNTRLCLISGNKWVAKELTDRRNDLLHSEQGRQPEEVDVLEEVEAEEGMLGIESDVELHVDVGIQVDVVGVDVVLHDVLVDPGKERRCGSVAIAVKLLQTCILQVW